MLSTIKPYLDKYNLISPNAGQDAGEDGLLFTLECCILTYDMDLIKFLKEDICSSYISDGLYKQSPAPLEGDSRYISHDILTTLVVASTKYGINIHKSIWKEMKRQLLHYDNITPPQTLKEKLLNKRILHPRDVLYYGYSADSLLCKLLLPILMLFLLIELIPSHKNIAGTKILATDGMLLNFIRVAPFKDNKISWRLFSKIQNLIIKIFYGGWGKLFSIYFKDKLHPCNISAKRL